MSVPKYALGVDWSGKAWWVVCLHSPFLVFSLRPSSDFQTAEFILPKATTPDEFIRDDFAAMKALVKRIGERALPGGLPARRAFLVEPIIRPSSLVLAVRLATIGIIDLRDLAAPVYAAFGRSGLLEDPVRRSPEGAWEALAPDAAPVLAFLQSEADKARRHEMGLLRR
jgi:hypothetical protein